MTEDIKDSSITPHDHLKEDTKFKAIEEEDDFDTLTEYSDLNEAVSAILKCRKFDSNDFMSKKHRQRLTYEQLTILEVEF